MTLLWKTVQSLTKHPKITSFLQFWPILRRKRWKKCIFWSSDISNILDDIVEMVWFVPKMATKMLYIKQLACCYVTLKKKKKKKKKNELENWVFNVCTLTILMIVRSIMGRYFWGEVLLRANNSMHLQKALLSRISKHIWFT